MAWGMPERGEGHGSRTGAVATTRAQSRAPAATAARTLSGGETAWLAAVPAAVVVVLAVVVLGPPLGRALLVSEGRFFQIFQFEVRPEPAEQGRFLVALTAPLLLAAFTALGLRLRPRMAPAAIDALVAAVQAAGLAFVVVCFLRQKEAFGPLYPVAEGIRPIPIDYFSVATLLVAALGTAAVVLAVRSSRLRATLAGWLSETRGRSIAAGLVAVAAIAIWLLHGIYTEDTIGLAFREIAYHVQFTMDETFAVLDGRSPLVDFAAQYGSLWPYAYAGAMSVLGDSLGVWVGLALATTGLGMFAVFALLRRAAGSSIAGLLLFLPVLAASFFMVGGTLQTRYTFGDYFGTFPMRYAGPSLLAWLVARHLGGARPRGAWLLFLAAGVVVLNNADAGVPALGATLAALLWAGGRPTRAGLGRLALAAAGGLVAAYALVSVLTLIRAGALPDLGLLLRFSRLFASAGFGMFPMPTLGLHVVVYLTFVAAIGVATVRALRADPDRLLTGLLAWSGVFGLGAGSYFAGRSTPDDLIALFFPWSLTLALLLIPALRGIGAASWRRPPIAAVGCVFGFLVLACSLAQTPTPWEQLERLDRTAAPVFAKPTGQAFIARHTDRGEPVSILVPLGHRIGANLDIVNTSLYASSVSMPTAEQFDDIVAALREAGGHKIFLRPSFTTPEMQAVLASAGFEYDSEDGRRATALWRDAAAG